MREQEHKPPGVPAMPALMLPEHARDIGRLYQALAEQFAAASAPAQAAREMQRAQWWLTYAMTLAQTGQGGDGKPS